VGILLICLAFAYVIYASVGLVTAQTRIFPENPKPGESKPQAPVDPGPNRTRD